MPADRIHPAPAGPGAVIISYKLVRHHLRVNRMARALADSGLRVHVIGLSEEERPRTEAGDGILFSLLPRFFSRPIIVDWLTWPLRTLRSIVEDDIPRAVGRIERRFVAQDAEEYGDGPEQESQAQPGDAFPPRRVAITRGAQPLEVQASWPHAFHESWRAEVKHLELNAWHEFAPAADRRSVHMRLWPGSFYWRIRRESWDGRISYSPTYAFAISPTGELDVLSCTQVLELARRNIKLQNGNTLVSRRWWLAKFNALKRRLQHPLRSIGRFSWMRLIPSFIWLRTMPVFPRQRMVDGRMLLSWLYYRKGAFYVEVGQGLRGIREIQTVVGSRAYAYPVPPPGIYLWRVRSIEPSSTWSRRLAFEIDHAGAFKPLASLIYVSEAFFLAGGGLIVSRRWLSNLLVRLIYSISVAFSGTAGRFPRLIEICHFSVRVWKIPQPEPVRLWIAHDLYAVPIVRWLAKRRGGDFIYDAVELSLGRQRPAPPGWLSRRIISAAEALAEDARVVFAGCPYLKKDLESRHPRMQPVLLLNGQPEYHGPRSTLLRERAGVAEGTPIVLYVGYIVPGRGIEEFIEAARLLKCGAHCIAMGDAAETYVEALHKLIDRLGLNRRFTIHPPVPSSEVVRMASGADAGVSPVPRNFGNGRFVLNNKVFQYIAAGIPVLASDVEGVGQFVTSEEIGLVFDERDPRSIAAAIDRLFGDAELLRAVRRQLLIVARKYNWDTQRAVFIEHALGQVRNMSGEAHPGFSLPAADRGQLDRWKRPG